MLEIKQLLRITRHGMGWAMDTARVVDGQMYTYTAKVVDGLGLQTAYNDDTSKGVCCVPTQMHVSEAVKGYPWAVHVSQIGCPLVNLKRRNGGARDFFTVHKPKMGFHGHLAMARMHRH